MSICNLLINYTQFQNLPVSASKKENALSCALPFPTLWDDQSFSLHFENVNNEQPEQEMFLGKILVITQAKLNSPRQALKTCDHNQAAIKNWYPL